MGLGDILGSISPAVGMATGKGLGQYLPYMSPAFLGYKALSGGDGGGQGISEFRGAMQDHREARPTRDAFGGDIGAFRDARSDWRGQRPDIRNYLGELGRLPDYMGGINQALEANAAKGQSLPFKLGNAMQDMPMFRSGAGMSAAQAQPTGGGMESFLQMILDSIGRR